MAVRQKTFLDYDGFVDKFKPKKTTDDCYTPENIYAEVLAWVGENVLPTEGLRILRPFYPGGDYQAEDYRPGDFVVDNPPFSILAQIVDFYQSNDIPFFLFAPSLTLFNYCGKRGVTSIVANASVTYANGAVVCTSFLTNRWPTDCVAVVRGDLAKRIEAIDKQNRQEQAKPLKQHAYPDNVTSSALLGKIANAGVCLDFEKSDCVWIRKMDCGQSVFGGGLLLSSRKAAELKAAELKAAELKAAELKAAELKAAELKAAARHLLSDRELGLIALMDEMNNQPIPTEQ